MADARPAPVPFDEAIRFLRQKVRLPTRTWTDLWQGMHARAFVVAGAVKGALIEDFQNAVLKALEQGTTLADFRKDFDRIVAQHGWSYNGSRGWRSAVILNTNLRTAYAAGKWEQAQRLKESRPYLRYVAVLDDRTRPEHRAWHGTVLAADDDWWKTHFPPNGWNCRCTVQTLSERDLDRFGYEVSEQAPPVELETREVNTPEGRIAVQAPKGIDTGFAYNVGEAAWGRGEELARLDAHGLEFERLFAPGGSRPADPGELPVTRTGTRLGRTASSEDELRAALRDAIGGDAAVLTDPTGERIAVNQAFVDHLIKGPRDGREAFFPLLRGLIEDPAEVWAGFARHPESGRVALRRRYVKALNLGRDQVVGFVADADGGHWSGLTFFRGDAERLKNLRWGLRLYKKG